jgi:histidyl-tRNA synthetase
MSENTPLQKTIPAPPNVKAPTITKLQGVKGMNDLLPDDSALQEAFEDIVRDVFRSYGYRLIRTPIVEPTALFVRGLGEVTDIVEKEMYSFTDALNGDGLTLRPEATAGIARSAIEHNWLYNGPQRVWTVGPMFRHERPQKGRYRQFYQFNVEALGFDGPDVEAEQIIMLARLWKRLGLKDVALHINSIGDAPERLAHREQLIAHFEAHMDVLDEEAKRRLHTNPLRLLDSKNPAMQAVVNAAPKLIDLLGEACLAHFAGLKALLEAAGIPYVINPRLVRGMDYYNRSVFEWVSTALGGEITITGGGRYDGLFEQLGGKPTPACGFGLGLERVMLIWQASLGDSKPAGVPVPDAYVVHLGEGTQAAAFKLSEQLRDMGTHCVLHAGGGSFKSQLKKADASKARFTLLLGESELVANQVAVKNMATGEQTMLALLDVLALAIALKD